MAKETGRNRVCLPDGREDGRGPESHGGVGTQAVPESPQGIADA